VLVPEDRTNPGSRLIRLSGMKISAASKGRSEHALALLIPGGPGGPTLDFVLRFFVVNGRFPPFMEHLDAIAFDQRGIGYSDASLCREIPAQWMRGVAIIPDGEARFVDDMRRCLNEARDQGIAVDAYSTWHSAHDVRDIRRALGYTQWNLWGGSYGGRLAQAVMQVDSQGVRAAILDSPIPAVFPAEGSVGTPVSLRSSLNAIQGACAKHARCSKDVGDLDGRLEALLVAYDAKPLVLEHLDKDLTENGRVVLDGQMLAALFFLTLRATPLYGGLPLFLKALEDRDVEAMTAHVTLGIDAFRAGYSFGMGMNFVTNCRSSFNRTSPAAGRSEPLSRWVVEPMLGDRGPGRCTAAYRADPDASVVELKSDIPALVLAGAIDAGPSVAEARSIMPGLTKGIFLEFPWLGHGVVPALSDLVPGCGDAVVVSFIENPEGPVDISCARAIGPPDFLTRVRETKRPLRFVSSIRDGARPIWPVIAAVGLLFPVIAFPVAAIGRRLDGTRDRSLRRIRLLSWFGATLSMAGGAVAGWAVFMTITRYPLALPIGVVPWIAWGGWLSLAGALAAVSGVILFVRGRKDTTVTAGSLIGACLTALLSIAFLVFLVSIGAGPVG
jgi:pimeloyl-ACP methyl ester carboxylesterase